MKYILNYLSKNSQIIFFFLLLYGLSISIFFKELNLIFFKNYDFNFIIIYRLLIIFFSFIVFFTMKKKINFIIFFLILLNFIFLFNSIFSEELKFNISAESFYRGINISYETFDSFFIDKNKILIINIFNIILPLIILSFCKNLNFNFERFKNLSLKIFDIYLFFLFLFIIYKLILVSIGTIKFSHMFINLHSMIYILNIHFALVLDIIFNNKKNLNNKNKIKLITIIICFILSNSFIHLAICFLTIIFYSLRFNLNKRFLLYAIILFFFLFLFSFFQIIYFDVDQILQSLNYSEPGNIINAIYVRMMNIKFFLIEANNLNLILGNNIFTDNIYTYPHNIFVDLIISTGFFGIFIFLILNLKLVTIVKLNLNDKNFFFLIILIQSFIFSNLSGFFFTNIIFNTVLATCLCFFIEKDSFIIKNS